MSDLNLHPIAVTIKPEVYETRQIRLTSPLIHIGGAVSQLSAFEFVKTDDRIYLPNLDALMSGIQQADRLDEYIELIKRRKPITELLESVFGEDWTQATGRNDKPIFPAHLSSALWGDRDAINELRPMIRDGFGRLYLPGTSIKGAIRTAIAYHLLKHGDRYNVPRSQQVSEIEHRLRGSMGELRRKAKFADDREFIDELFSNFSLSYQGLTVSPRTGPNTDFMRAVQVTDSAPLLETDGDVIHNRAIVPEVLVTSHFQDGNAKYRASIFPEMVRSVETEFTLSVDYEMLSWFQHRQGMIIPFKTVGELLQICQEFAQDQWVGEQQYWRRVQTNPDAQGKNLNFSAIRSMYEPECCPYSLKIGWGSGLPGTTVTMLLDAELRSEIRDTCGIRAPGFEAPKSRRTVVALDGTIQFVPGWVKFEEVVAC